MQHWLILSLLVVLGFVITESLVIRSHRNHREKIDFFMTLHRLFIQRRSFRLEDFIALSSAAFLILLTILVITTRLEVRFGAEAEAQVTPNPLIASEQIRQGGASIKDDLLASGEVVLGESVQRYEEYVFDVQPAFIAQKPLSWEAELFALRVGRKVLDRGSSGGILVRASEDRDSEGALGISDGHTLQKAGTYEAFFKLRFSDNTLDEVVARAEVWDEHRHRKIFERDIRGTDFEASGRYQYLGGTYTRENIGSLQVRLVYFGKGELDFDKVEINPLELEETVYERHLFYGDIPDPKASESLVRQASLTADIPGRIAFGPYDDSVKEGFYRAVFRLKVTDNVSQYKVALIDVASSNSDFNAVYREVRPSDFTEAGAYQDFSLDFYNPGGGALEFRVYYYGTTDLFFDYVDLLKLDMS